MLAKILLVGLSLFLSSARSETVSFRTADGAYRSGQEWVSILLHDVCVEGMETEFCVQAPSFLQPGRFGFIRVPLDYTNVAAGEIEIFYRTNRALDPSKPTVLFLNGGPGGTSQGYKLENGMSGWNWIYMDQRGTGLSKPALWDQLLNPGFFSSELVVKDMVRVLDALNVSKATIYGHSYGTVPATIFASRFPDRTTSVVLEGTIAGGGVSLWNAPHRLALLNHFLKQLPESLRQSVLNLTNTVPGLTAVWFSRMAQRAMYGANFRTEFRETLERIVAQDPAQTLLEYNFSFGNNDEMLVEHYTSGPLFAHHVMCQELSSHILGSSFDAVLQNGQLVASTEGSLAPGCQVIEAHPRFKKSVFNAEDYPLTVPVTYLQGMVDGATSYREALSHFRGATETQRQMVLVVDGGHIPVLGCLQEPGETGCPSGDKLSTVLDMAFKGQPLSDQLVNSLGDKWKFAGRRSDGTRFR